MELVEVLTVGFPFCAFKILAGLALGSRILILIGLLDLVINAINLITLLLKKRRLLDTCLIAIITRVLGQSSRHPKWAWQDLGTSLDIVLSFSLVALIIGGGFLGRLTPPLLACWNVSVVFNVIGAGVSRLGSSLRSLAAETTDRL